MYLLITLCIIHVFAMGKATAVFSCDSIQSTQCACIKQYTNYNIECPSTGTPKLKLSAVDGQLKIECLLTDDSYTSYLPHLNQQDDLEYFGMESCNLLPNTSLASMLQDLGASNAEAVRIRYGNMSMIKRTDFIGLTNTKFLELSACDLKQVPKDLLYDLNELESVNFHSNQIVLHPDFFAQTPNIMNIELGDNNMGEIPTGLFSNLTHLRRLNLWANNLSSIDSNVFENLSALESLELLSNVLKILPQNLFQNLTSLNSISVRKNLLKALPEGLFANNANLNEVRFDYNSFLEHIPEHLFANKTLLNHVSFAFCNLNYIPISTFMDCPNLTTLYLSQNNLTHLNNGVFNTTIELTYLKLDNNRLEVLDDFIFIKLKNLRELNLNHNKLQLNPNTFYGLKNLNELYLSNNELSALSEDVFKHFTNLQILDLSYNELTLTYPSNVYSRQSILSNFNTLERLNLQHNKISTVFDDFLLVFVSLTYLDLNHNQIKDIDFHSVNFLQDGIVVDLSSNQIERIDLKEGEVLTSINRRHKFRAPAQINLEDNPIKCDCFVYDLLRFLEGSMDDSVYDRINLQMDHVTCSEPKDLRGVSIQKLKSKSLVCLINDGPKMPISCSKSYYQYRPSDATLIMDCSDNNLTSVPTIENLPFNGSLEVHLQGNALKSFPNNSALGYDKVTYLDLSHNEIEHLLWIPSNIKILKLNHNNFSTLSKYELSLLNVQNLTNITFHNNPWVCDCNLVNFMVYLQENFKKVSKFNTVSCKSDNRTVMLLTKADLCSFPTEAIVGLSAALAVMSLVAAIFAALYYRYQQAIKVWMYAHRLCLFCVTEEEIDKDKLYDAFISFSHKDEEFVVNELLPKLESGPDPYKLCIHFRNWLPGEFISTNIAKSIEESRRTVVVLSPSFLESEWGKMEFRTAHIQALTEGRVRVIVIIYGQIGPVDQLEPELKAYLTTNTYIEWGDPWFWEKLRYALPHSPKYRSATKSEKKSDRTDLMRETNSIPLASTPPADFIEPKYEQTSKHTSALNVALVNNKLVNNGHIRSVV